MNANGTFTNILLTAIGGLLMLVQGLFWLVGKAHVDRDDERYLRVEGEIESKASDENMKRIEVRIEQIAKRVHDLTAVVGKVEQVQRFYDQDKNT